MCVITYLDLEFTQNISLYYTSKLCLIIELNVIIYLCATEEKYCNSDCLRPSRKLKCSAQIWTEVLKKKKKWTEVLSVKHAAWTDRGFWLCRMECNRILLVMSKFSYVETMPESKIYYYCRSFIPALCNIRSQFSSDSYLCGHQRLDTCCSYFLWLLNILFR